ncbi:MAG: response regulator [Eubacteriales bacterium]|nr:response regulator [Eubacteriales bacterium]
MLKVFLVEDETLIREGLRDIIPWQQYGYILVGDAGDGEQALPMIRKLQPDVLITDIKMPFMDGLALSSHVSREFPGTKIIIISGYDDFEYARQAIRIGVEQYLLKPITKTMLIRTLNEVREKIDSEREQKNYLEQFRNELTARFDEVSQIFSSRHLAGEREAAEHTGEPAGQDDESSLKNVDMAKIDPQILQGFLKDGTAEQVEAFVEEYIGSVYDAAGSRLFCQYLMLNVRFTVTAYIESLGYPQEDFIDTLPALPRGQNISVSILKEYMCAVLRCALELRDKEEQGSGSAIIRQALEYIDRNFADEAISLKEVAGYTNVTANYFSAVFSQEMGQTFVEYLTQKRMERAKELLRGTDRRASEIAAEVGYKDSHYFSYVFRKTQGCTPRDYRTGGKRG